MAHHIPASPGPRVAGNETVARVRNLHVLHSTVHTARAVVEDVNFDLRRGERLGVAGGEAPGTSALARAISGHPARGETVVGGIVDSSASVRELADGARARMPLIAVTQAASPNEAVRLEREAICLALQDGAEVVVVDQTSELPRDSEDEPNAAFLTRTFEAHDAALVLVTEDLDALRQTCDTVQILLAGRIVERGPAAEILSSPHHRYAEALVAANAKRRSDDPGGRSSSALWMPATGSPLDGCAFEPHCPVGRGRHDCSTTFPPNRSFPNPSGSVTVKCHQPIIGSAGSGQESEESTR